MSAVRLTFDQIEMLAAGALRRHGASEKQAAALAAGMARAGGGGLKSRGLMYPGPYGEHLTGGKIVGSAEPTLSRRAPASLVVDAGCGFAHAAINLGLPALVETARSHGVATLA